MCKHKYLLTIVMLAWVLISCIVVLFNAEHVQCKTIAIYLDPLIQDLIKELKHERHALCFSINTELLNTMKEGENTIFEMTM